MAHRHNQRLLRIIRVSLLLLVPMATSWSAEKATGVSFDVCHGFGCSVQTTVQVSAGEWGSVVALFGAANPKEERDQIKHALARMEYLAGLYSPISRDVAGNLPLSSKGTKEDRLGQLDCVDEAVNATRFLALFQHAGLLRFHRVLRAAYRRTLFNQHWAAHVEEIPSGRRFVFDTWFYDNGQPPVLVSSERWHDLSLRGIRGNSGSAGWSTNQAGDNR